MKKFFATSFVFLFTTLAHAFNPPLLRDYVTDLTGTLSQNEQSQLSSELFQFEQKTSNQIVIVVIPNLEGNEIREVGRQIFEKNKIGEKKKDNGVLFLVAKDDRKMSIEVGYGLEGALPDATANQIIRNEIAPFFKKGEFNSGIIAGVQAIEKATQGEYKPKPKRVDYSILIPLFLWFLILLSLFRRRKTISSRGFGTGFYFGGFGGGGGFGSGGGGGGGFSGGGGSFGGGGSSGSW